MYLEEIKKAQGLKIFPLFILATFLTKFNKIDAFSTALSRTISSFFEKKEISPLRAEGGTGFFFRSVSQYVYVHLELIEEN